MKVGRPKALARWVSWIFGLALLASVVMFAAHYRQEKALAQLLHRARPVWLLVALLLDGRPDLATGPLPREYIEASPLLCRFGAGEAFHGPGHS